MNLRTALPVLALVAGAAGVLPAQSRQARKRPVVPPLTIAARPAVVPPVDSLRLTDVALRSRTVAGAVGKGVDARAKASREPMARPADRWISLVSFMGSRYDSNVNRDLVPTRSVGMVSGLGLRLQAGGDRPWLATEYDAAVHRYSATERFDRVSQRLRISATAQLARALEVGLVSEGSLKGSAEDRDVADQVAVLPRVDLRLSDRHRLRLGRIAGAGTRMRPNSMRAMRTARSNSGSGRPTVPRGKERHAWNAMRPAATASTTVASPSRRPTVRRWESARSSTSS